MEADDILFSINEYDSDGSLLEEGIYIHFADTKIKLCERIEEFEGIVRRFNIIFREILNR